MNRSISSTTRLAINIAMVSLSVLLLAHSAGLFPNTKQAETDARIAICESLAVNCSIMASQNNVPGIDANLEMLTSRNDQVVSAGLRGLSGQLVASAGGHETNWGAEHNDTPNASHVFVPIYQNNRKWGRLEVCFQPDELVPLFHWQVSPWVRLVTLVTLTNLLLFMLYLRRMLKHLDPTRAVPSRVRAALDALSEGLVVLDKKFRIMLANKSFLRAVGRKQAELVGRTPAELPWDEDSAKFWTSNNSSSDVPLTLITDGEPLKLLVSATEIIDEGGVEQGTLVTFNDVTALERNREKLVRTNQTLQESRDKIQEQNEQLQILATRDPLTNCWNRRAFFEELHSHWDAAVNQDLELCALMVDVDHFKNVNDNHGHAMGDRVLRDVSFSLLDSVRSTDFVCRYGGEEFCVLLPNMTLDQCMELAEKLRVRISELEFEDLSVTASLGASSIRLEAGSPEDLLEQADKALYFAKRNGRDQSVSWDNVPDDIEVDESAVSRVPEAAADSPTDSESVPFQVVTSLLSALSFRDPETAAHSMRVADLSFLLGQGLLPASELYALEVAALLHDIGKIGVPDSILLKPDALNEEEWKIMGQQTRMGVEIVETAFQCKSVEVVMRYHHLPYISTRPGQLNGEDIPLGARIVSIADAYDSMVTDRVFRKGRSQEDAFRELRRCGGSQFDPDLVERFIDILESQPYDTSPARSVSTSKHLALHLGQSTDRIARAYDAFDLETLQAQASRLQHTAKKYDNEQIEQIANRLAEATGMVQDGDDAEVPLILAAVIDLLEVCRAAQRQCLNQAKEVRERVRAGL